MKTIIGLVLTLVTVGVLAGCEEEHEHHRHDRGYGGPGGPVVGHGYYRDGYYQNGYYYDSYGRPIVR